LRPFDRIILRAAGVATHYVPSARLPELENSLKNLGESGKVSAESVGTVIEKYAEKTGLIENYKL
jgi:hypothetical protein